MKLAKSLLLGAAAGLVGVASASAADLPARTKGPAVEYVRICDAYGTGYFYIPGTETCLKVFGQVRAEYRFGSQGKTFTTGAPTLTNFPAVAAVPATATTPAVAAVAARNNVPTGYIVGRSAGAGPTPATQGFRGRNYNVANAAAPNAFHNIRAGGTTATQRSKDQSVWFSRASIRLDARTQTSYGVLRSFAAVDFNTTNNSGALGIDKAFIQWAGITAGYAQSMFDFYADDAGYSGLRTSDSTVNMLAYTAVFGGGFSATISAEDPKARQYGIINLNPNATGGTNPNNAGFVGATYSGTRAPNVIGALRVDQSWGSAQVSAAAHQTVSQNSALIATTTFGKQTWGYAVQAGVKINLPFLGAGDAFFLQGAYGNGANAYVLEGAGSTAAGNTVGGFPGGITQLHGDVVALPCIGVGCTGYRLDKEKSYSVLAALEHYWTPTIRTDIYGGYARVTPGSASKNGGDWRLGYLGNWTEYRAAATLQWTPVSGLSIGVDGIYARVNQSLAHAPGVAASTTLITTGGVTTNFKKDYDSFSGRLRLNRTF